MENGKPIFCSYCGKEAPAGSEICLGCGCKIKNGNKFCVNCGESLSEGQVACVKCNAPVIKNCLGRKNRIAAFLFAFFLGWLGVHKFYLGKPGLGALYLVCGTIGWLLILPPFIIGVISLIEAILYICMSDEEFDVKYN